MDYTELIEKLRNDSRLEILDWDNLPMAANSIEALQAQVTNEHINCAMADESVRILQARVTTLEKVIALQVENYAELSEQNDAQHGYFNSVMQEREALQARVTELEDGINTAYLQSETHKAEVYKRIEERDAALAKLEALEKQEPVAYAAVEQEIVQRYRVEKTRGGFWPCCVKAGNGTMDIFVGSQKQAEHVRQALQAACLDGAFMASKARPVPAKTLTDEQIDALWILTPEHDDGNDFVFFARAIETALKGGA